MKPKIPDYKKVSKYLSVMDTNQIYSNNGPLVRDLESRFSQFFGIDPELIVCSSNATLAIQGSAFLLPSLNFQVPTYTFPASITAVINTGKNIHLNDVDENDWKNGCRNKVINNHCLVDVLPFGAPLHTEQYKEWDCAIIDAAASIGSEELDFKFLKNNHVVIFSLHATKVLGIGEGGIAIFGSKAFADEFRAWINFGFFGSRNSILPGINAKMSEIAAAYGHAALDDWQLERIEWEKANKQAKVINSELMISSVPSRYSGVNPYWIADFHYSEIAESVSKNLHFWGIETRRWWEFGWHRMPAGLSEKITTKFPTSDQISGRILGLPMSRNMQTSEFQYIYEVLEETLKSYHE
jgi:dTDP-4-amino-4,6-dideoxygalactose transaminase